MKWWLKPLPLIILVSILAGAGLKTLLISLPVIMIFYRLQLSRAGGDLYAVLWLPLLLFLSTALFSSLVLRAYRHG